MALTLRVFGISRSCRRYSTGASKIRDYYDVTISGGGLVGTAAAVALASDAVLRSCSVLLIEPHEPSLLESVPERFSNRVYSITPGTRRFLEEIAVWDKIQSLRIQPVRRLQIWESRSDAAITFSPPNSEEEISYIVEEPVLSTALWTRLRQLPGVDVLHGARAENYRIPSRRSKMAHAAANSTSVQPEPENQIGEADDVEVELSDGRKIQTSLLIGADGANSAVRKAMKVQYVSWNYQQKGLVATLLLSEPQDNSIGWQRFLPTGPIALLPLNATTSSLVWSTSTEEADKLLRLDDEEFLDTLNRSIWDDQGKSTSSNAALETMSRTLSKFGVRSQDVVQLPPTISGIDPGSRAAFPLGLGHAAQDAAHRIHPLAGLGVNLGFGDVVSLRDCLRLAVASGCDVSSLTHLLRYEKKAQRTNLPIMASTDVLNRLYRNTWNPLVTLRSLGLVLLNSCDPVKKQLVKLASL